MKIVQVLPAFILMALSIMSCDPVKPVSQKEAFGEEVAKEQGTVFESDRVKELNHSSNYFDEAIRAIEAGDKQKAADDLRKGADVLVNEGQFLKGVPRERLQYVTQSLETLATNVASGTKMSISDIEDIVSEAELSVAQEYAVDLDEVTVNVPMPDTYFPHYKAMMKAIEGTIPRLKEPMKSAAQKLVEESKDLMHQLDIEDDVSDQQMRMQQSKMKTFLKLNHLKQH
jgi:hypothetical protein